MAKQVAKTTKPVKTAKAVKKPAEKTPPAAPPESSRYKYALYLVLSAAVAFIGAQILGPTIIAFCALFGGVKGTELVSFLDSTVMRFVMILSIEFLTVWGVMMLLRRRKWSWGDIGLGRKPQWLDAAHGGLFYLIYMAIFLAVYWLEQVTGLINTEQAQQLGFDNAKGPVLIFVLFALVILPPVAEEIIFRGYIFMGLRKRLTYIQSALITSVLFGIAHLEFGSGAPLNWAAAIDTFTLSMVLTYVADKYKSLWPGMAIHAIKNLLAFTMLFLVK